MARFKVQSGDYEVVVTEKTCRKAADLAIQLHDRDGHTEALGELTLVEKLNRRGEACDHAFLNTRQLLDDNTPGYGDGDGQYSKMGDG